MKRTKHPVGFLLKSLDFDTVIKKINFLQKYKYMLQNKYFDISFLFDLTIYFGQRYVF